MSAETGHLINIAEMIDLAIGTPEVGVVDFCMLQTVLHCLAQQLGVRDKNVELRGSIANLPVGRQPEGSMTIAVDEYILETDGNPPATPEEQNTMLVVQRIKKGEEEGGTGGDKQPSGKPPHDSGRPKEGRGGSPKKTMSVSPGATRSTKEVVAEGIQEKSSEDRLSTGAPRPISSTEKLSLVTLSKFNMLESTVEDLKNRVYGSIPKNEEILQEVRSQTNLKAITDMWTSLNVSSRLEAVEEGIGKLSSLVQDLIADPQSARVTTGQPSVMVGSIAKEAPVGLTTAQTVTESSINQGKSQLTTRSAPTQSMVLPEGMAEPSRNIMFAPSSGTNCDMDAFTSKDDLINLINFVENLRNDHDDLSKAFYSAMHDLKIDIEPPTSSLPSAISSIMPKVSQQTSMRVVGTSQGSDPATMQKIANLSNKLEDLEYKLRQCYETVFAPSGTLQDQINSLQDQMEHYSRYAATDASDSTKLSPDLAKDLQGLMELFQTVQNMQVQLQQVHDTAQQLAREKEDKQYNINSLLEQVELLKAIKLDREDMVEALADKADLNMLARKVSHDQFEMACDDLSRGLEHALGKLNVQESLWQQALDDIQREIETKLDKMELSPVKEFFHNKLKQLQENLKQMAALRREVEAAGTKRKLLTDVNCISCDAKAVMSMEPSAPAGTHKPLPPSMSMKPYLSYELDTIRKTQASNIPQRNMHDWERIDKQMAAPRQLQKVRSETDKHLCNRYCGGSHTTTTPAQRVARLGHFIKQWGPEVLPLSSGFATGDDGRMYKVSTVEGANVGPGNIIYKIIVGGAVDGVTCTLKSAKKIETKPQKPILISAECRCLDG